MTKFVLIFILFLLAKYGVIRAILNTSFWATHTRPFIRQREHSHFVRREENNAFHSVCRHMADNLDRLLVRAWKLAIQRRE